MRPRQNGFTLLELLATVAILAILMGAAAPSMRQAIEKRRSISAAEAIINEIQLARSESIARSQDLFMNISGGTNWAIGFSDDAACDPTDNNPPCTLPDLDDNNPITNRLTSADRRNVSIAATANQLTFSPQRGMVTGASIDVTSVGPVGYIVRVNVGLLGQIRLCSPNADPRKYVSAYRPCS